MLSRRKVLWQTKSLWEIQKRSLVINIEERFDNKTYKTHLLDDAPSHTVELSKEEALEYYSQMNLIRSLEAICAKLYLAKKVRGFCHLNTGQEAITVGVYNALRPQDTVITSYRCHGLAYLTCGSIPSVLAEMMGLVSGINRGKGGSIHLFGPRFYGGNGIVGAQVPLGAGLALKHKYTITDGISITMFGDGAFNQGQVSETFNLSKLLQLPVVFIVENNNYAMGTASERSSANPEYYKGSTFIPGVRASGMDILSVRETLKFAYTHILDGKGPIVVEFMTYRYFGHSMSDPGTSYRTREEIQSVREKKDAIALLRSLIIEGNLASEEEVKNIEVLTKKAAKKALKDAEQGTPPPLEELTGDCYELYSDKIRVPQMLHYREHKHFANYKKSEK